MTRLPTDAFAAVVGLDWADAKPDVCLQAAGSETREVRVLAHPPETSAEGVHTLRKRCKGQPVAICLELNNGPLVSALRQYDGLVLFSVTPLTLARYREACAPSHAKDDPTDAALQLARLRTHRDQLTPLKPQRAALRALAPRVAPRRRLVGDNVRLTTRLRRTLKNYFPHVLQWVHDKDPTRFCAFLAHWPTLQAAQLARRSTLAPSCCTHHVRDAAVIEQRLHAIKSATPLTTDAGIIVPNALLVQALVTQLRVTLQAIEDFDHALAHRAQSPPDFSWFAAFPGAGAVFAPRLLVAFGEPRDRYASADALQKEAGIAPVTERRGNTTWGPWRLQCPTFLRQTFVEWAAESIRHSCWARGYDQPHRDQGKAPQAAVRALAVKSIRLLSRCWQDHTPYDEASYLRALTHRGSPLRHTMGKSSDNVKKP